MEPSERLKKMEARATFAMDQMEMMLKEGFIDNVFPLVKLSMEFVETINEFPSVQEYLEASCSLYGVHSFIHKFSDEIKEKLVDSKISERLGIPKEHLFEVVDKAGSLDVMEEIVNNVVNIIKSTPDNMLDTSPPMQDDPESAEALARNILNCYGQSCILHVFALNEAK